MDFQTQTELLECFDDEYNPLVKIGKAIGPAALEVVLKELGGTKPHIPQQSTFWSTLEREVRDEEIRAKFQGNNYDLLADEYYLSERQVREIVAKPGKRYQRPPEPTRPVQVPVAVYEKLQALTERHGTSMRAVVACVLEATVDTPQARKALLERFGQQCELLQVVNG